MELVRTMRRVAVAGLLACAFAGGSSAVAGGALGAHGVVKVPESSLELGWDLVQSHALAGSPELSLHSAEIALDRSDPDYPFWLQLSAEQGFCPAVFDFVRLSAKFLRDNPDRGWTKKWHARQDACSCEDYSEDLAGRHWRPIPYFGIKPKDLVVEGVARNPGAGSQNLPSLECPNEPKG